MASFSGTNGNDTITPTSVSAGVFAFPFGAVPSGVADLLNGNDGNDVLDGGGGADTVNGGSGNDTIDVRLGGDHDGGDDNDTFLVFSAAAGTTIAGGAGIDSFDAQGSVNITGAALSGVENLALDASTLTLTAAQLAVFIDIIADAGSTTGNIVLSGSGAATTDVSGLLTLNVTGSGGNDTLFFTATGLNPTDILVNAGNGLDSLNGGGGSDSLNGDAGNDSLDGNLGADSLNGGAGNDVITVTNDDTALGGTENDLFLVLENLTLSGTIDGGTGTDTLNTGGVITLGAAVVITGVETLALDSSLLTMTAGQLNGFTTITADLLATTGNLALSLSGSATTAVTGLTTLNVTAAAGDDSLVFTAAGGTPTDIAIDAGNGHDSIETGNGDDTLIGGLRNDTLDGNSGLDSLSGGDGADVLVVRNGDAASGGNDDDLFQVNGTQSLVATLDGGFGLDTFEAQGVLTVSSVVTIVNIENLALDASALTMTTAQLESFTRIVPDAAVNGLLNLSVGGTATTEVTGLTTLTVSGSGGNEVLIFTQPGVAPTGITVNANNGDDTITTGNGADVLNGGAGVDDLDGGASDDTLTGGSGRDTLNGGNGADLLIGELGGDRVKGGDGDDLFRFNLPTDGQDKISDFVVGEDLLQIDASGFLGGLVGGAPLAAGQLVVHTSNDATAPAGTGQFIFNTAKSLLLWDVDGTGAASAQKIAKLSGLATLATSDFDIIA